MQARCIFALLFLLVLLHAPQAHAQNKIVLENALTGNPASEWDVTGAGDSSIQGFATDISAAPGDTVQFKVDTRRRTPSGSTSTASAGTAGSARARSRPSRRRRPLAQSQPACLNDAATGLIDCGNWGVSASWSVPANAVSGIYVAKLVREDAGNGARASHVVFVVRDDTGGSNLLFQTSDTTWQAYNQYGGNSLYVGGPGTNPGRAYKVSYNRPFTTRGTSPEDWVFNAEYPMVRWLERNGYDVSYTTGVDTDRRGAELLEHHAFLSVGHDEYWSGPAARQRRGGARRRREPRLLLRQRGVLEDALGELEPDARLLQGDARGREDRSRCERVDRHLARPARVQPRGWEAPRTRSPARSSPSTAAPTPCRCPRPTASCASGAAPTSRS